jgi:hypothetical protein
MSKKVSFPEQPFLIRQISDQSEARKQNSQTPIEKRLASNSFFIEEKRKYNTDEKTKEKYEKKHKYINTPINERVVEAVIKGNKEDSRIRNEAILEEHRYDYWWLGGNNKQRKKSRSKRKSRSKTIKRNKTKSRRNNYY